MRLTILVSFSQPMAFLSRSFLKHLALASLLPLAVLIAMRLPVISVSNDLFAIQNASEADSSFRRDHLVRPSEHPAFPAQIALLTALFAGLRFGFLHLVSPDRESIVWLNRPEGAAIQSRPPPAA